MAVELRCIEEGHEDKRWMLDLNGPKATLLTMHGQVVMEFGRGDAYSRFRMPGLAGDARHFAINLDEQTVRFAVDPVGLQQIEKFLNGSGASAAARPSASPKDDTPAVLRINQLNPYGAMDIEEPSGPRRGGRATAKLGMFVLFVGAGGHAVLQGMALLKALKAAEAVHWMTWGQMALGVAVGGLLALICLGSVFSSGDVA
ncbi:MAG: hypothetical protein L0Y44_10905 [Phycisphaerales bacterium]|nr:hypothetical protein [Phycisphaerales bacterium]MCI0631147.1 hypothetical protein [Phycisphaerales bacterium]MCI0675151.1 hypothetical protein [Phycisphaerales bacterium]